MVDNVAVEGAAPAIPPTFTFEAFDKNKSKWSRWVKRLEGACEIYGVPENRRQMMLLHYMGAETYNILCDLLGTVEPDTKTYVENVDMLGKYFEPPPLEMVQLWRFRSRIQKDGESIAEFVTALRRDSKHCEFGDYLEKALRNQLVFGLSNQRIKARLIEEKELTFEKAQQIALSMEASGVGVEVLNQKLGEVNLVTKKKINHEGKKVSSTADCCGECGAVKEEKVKNRCFRCGSDVHLANLCPHKNTVCAHCKKKGHLKRVCITYATGKDEDSGETKSSAKQETNWIEAGFSDDEIEDENFVIHEIV